MTVKKIAIIGGGSAGYSSIKGIRSLDKNSEIIWITNEDRTPYKRTHINKNITTGFGKNDFALVGDDFLSENKVTLLFDYVKHIDTENQTLQFSAHPPISFDKLIIATGNKPKELNIQNCDNIEQVYTAKQVESIMQKTDTVNDVVIFGAGVEGIETANQLINAGKNVTIVDRKKVILNQYFNERFSSLIENTIIKAGVRLILNSKSISYQNKTITIDGIEQNCDMIISTIGYIPNIQLAQESNIDCNRGILVNEYLQTSAKNIFAAGDAAEHPDGRITGLWHAAEQQGYIAGRNACGDTMKNELPPFRMKTQVFNQFFFSVPPQNKNYEKVSEESCAIIRDLFFVNNKLEAALMQNDGERAKLYQKALLEGWSKEKINEEIPLISSK